MSAACILLLLPTSTWVPFNKIAAYTSPKLSWDMFKTPKKTRFQNLSGSLAFMGMADLQKMQNSKVHGPTSPPVMCYRTCSSTGAEQDEGTSGIFLPVFRDCFPFEEQELTDNTGEGNREGYGINVNLDCLVQCKWKGSLISRLLFGGTRSLPWPLLQILYKEMTGKSSWKTSPKMIHKPRLEKNI